LAEKDDLDAIAGGRSEFPILEDRADAVDDLGRLVRLRQETVGTTLEPSNDIHRLVVRREQHDGQR